MPRGTPDDLIVIESEEFDYPTAEQDTAASETDSLGIPDFLDEELFARSNFSIVPFEEIKGFYDRLSNASDAESIATPAPTTPESTRQTLEDFFEEEEEVGFRSEEAGEALNFVTNDPDDGSNAGEASVTLPLVGDEGSLTILVIILSESPAGPLTTSAHTQNNPEASIPVAGSSTSGRRRVRLTRKEDDGKEPGLPKDPEGYVNPLAIYTRLNNKIKTIKTEALDRLIAPQEDTSTKNFELATITCQMRRRIANGAWKARENKPCSTKVDSWDSYRRHLLRCHLDLPRGKNLSEDLERKIQELAVATTSSVASTSSPSGPTGDQDTQTQISLLGIKRPRDPSDVESDAEDDEDYSPKKRRSVQKKRTKKNGKEC
ncbi:hypothetical protein FS842_008796 [Serendipita sp. 407]|nr:hypothetical protein FRC15_000382 [Serendipita sp. 397]KAG8801127.1 hypothetical protein FRC16_001236 [Serendipita sp. 398]KAG8869629.1 hypothetical protein FRC20_001149 [Serendipita sp. 405]KAG9058499.1 hypothetical protein FS842_008796 [Serendipita sp. 407]